MAPSRSRDPNTGQSLKNKKPAYPPLLPNSTTGNRATKISTRSSARLQQRAMTSSAIAELEILFIDTPPAVAATDRTPLQSPKSSISRAFPNAIKFAEYQRKKEEERKQPPTSDPTIYAEYESKKEVERKKQHEAKIRKRETVLKAQAEFDRMRGIVRIKSEADQFENWGTSDTTYGNSTHTSRSGVKEEDLEGWNNLKDFPEYDPTYYRNMESLLAREQWPRSSYASLPRGDDIKPYSSMAATPAAHYVSNANQHRVYNGEGFVPYAGFKRAASLAPDFMAALQGVSMNSNMASSNTFQAPQPQSRVNVPANRVRYGHQASDSPLLLSNHPLFKSDPTPAPVQQPRPPPTHKYGLRQTRSYRSRNYC